MYVYYIDSVCVQLILVILAIFYNKKLHVFFFCSNGINLVMFMFQQSRYVVAEVEEPFR